MPLKIAPLLRNNFTFIAACILSLAVPIVLVIWGVNSLLEYKVAESIKNTAEYDASQWTKNYFRQIPSIETIIANGAATPEQAKRIERTISANNIFRFKLFSPEGYVRFVSDQQQFTNEGGSNFSEKALDVASTEDPIIMVKDGHNNANRPETYVEAYLPAHTPDGKKVGVIEVYVNATTSAAVLKETMAELSLYLIAGTLLIFLIPSGTLIWRSHQLRMRDLKVFELSCKDHLTNVLSRKTLSEKISEMLARRRDTGSVGIVFIDVDHFKAINDTYGHKIGDRLLKHIANILRDSIRKEIDIVGRRGGDEFVIACDNIRPESLMAICRRIQDAAHKPFVEDNVTIFTSLSIGYYISKPNEDEEHAVHAADLAVYEAKRLGRNRIIEHYEGLDVMFQRRQHIEFSLKHAIEAENLRLYFQPIFDAGDRGLIGCEALLRLVDPDGNTIMPGEFIPIAEETGLIEDIGAWVLKQAIVKATALPRELFVAANLSARQFRDGKLPSTLASMLSEYNLDPQRLELEITESLLIENEEKSRKQLDEMINLGVSIVLDDFGAGYSSLGYLWKYKFHKLKIDRSFFSVHEHSPEKFEEIMQAIVTLGKAMNMTIVAEGVETEDNFSKISAIGVDQVQGYLLGRPMPEDQFDQVVSQFFPSKIIHLPKTGTGSA